LLHTNEPFNSQNIDVQQNKINIFLQKDVVFQGNDHCFKRWNPEPVISQVLVAR